MIKKVEIILLLSTFIISAFATSEVIHIGALFDETTDQEQSSAFHHAINDLNKHRGHFRIVPVVTKTHMNDSYKVAATICKLLAGGIFGYIIPHNSETFDIIRSYSSTFQMPFITSGTAVSESKSLSGLEIFVRPVYATAVFDVIKYYNWNAVWYIFENDDGLERLQQLLDAMKEENFPADVKIYRVTDADHTFETLSRIDSRRDDGKKIILDLSKNHCQDVLDRQKRDSRGMLHHYFIVTLEMSEMSVEVLNHGGLNITGFRLVDPTDPIVQSFVTDWSKLDPKIYPGAGFLNMSVNCALIVDAVNVHFLALSDMITKNPNFFRNTMRNGKLLNNGTEELECDGNLTPIWKQGPDIVKYFKKVQFNGLTGRVRFDKFGMRKDFKLDILEVHLSRPMAKIGTWQSSAPSGSRIQVHAVQIIRSKGNNTIANRTRIITSVLSEPYLMKLESDNENEEYVGYCADLASMIAEKVGFDYKIVPVKDGQFGAVDANNTWNGMVGELIRHEADIAIAPLTITADREKVIDFSKPFMSLGISIMIKKPTEENPGVFSFMNPLSYEIWMCVIFAYIGVSVVLFLVSRFSPFEWHIEDNTDGPSVTNNFTIFNSLWFSLGAFMQQGCDIEPRSISGRIVGSVWWFFTLIIISSYTANLAAFLTVERMQSPIESAEDLSKQTEIKYGTLESGSTRQFFESSTIPMYERMWAFMSTADPSLGLFVASTEEGVKKVREGKYAYLIESTTNDYINLRPPCNTMKVGSNLDSKGYGIGTVLGSDLRDRITLAVLELSEGEKLARLEKKWWHDNFSCQTDTSVKKQEATSSLKLPNVAGIFYILISGLSLALVTAIVEFFYKSKLEADKKKTTFGIALRSKAKLSIAGLPDSQTLQFMNTPSSQLITLDSSEYNCISRQPT